MLKILWVSINFFFRSKALKPDNRQSVCAKIKKKFFFTDLELLHQIQNFLYKDKPFKKMFFIFICQVACYLSVEAVLLFFRIFFILCFAICFFHICLLFTTPLSTYHKQSPSVLSRNHFFIGNMPCSFIFKIFKKCVILCHMGPSITATIKPDINNH